MIRSLLRRALRRLGILGLARRMLGRERPAPHGHGLLVRLLPSLTADRGAYVVEVGSTREKLPGQGSTVVLAELCSRLGLRFVTVDMDPQNTEQARRDLLAFPEARAVNARGEEFLASFVEPIVAAYLDAFDIDHGHHSTKRIERYRQLLATEITNEACAQMHLECARALLTRVVEGGVVAVDDTWSEEGGAYGGKGATAVPYLLDEGWQIIASTRTAVALQRPRLAARG